MPIDPNIPLSVKAPELPSPLEVFSTVTQIQAQREAAELRRLAADEAREKRERQVAIDHAKQAALKFDEKTGRISFDKQKLLAGLPGDLAYQAQQELDADEININKLASSVLDVEGKRRDYRGSIARTIRAAKYDPTIFRTLMRGAHGFGAIEPDVLDRYETLEDPTQIQAVVDDYISQTGKEEDLVAVKTVDAQGREVTKFVRKEPGVEYPVAPSSAEGVSYQDVDAIVTTPDGKTFTGTVGYNPKTNTYAPLGSTTPFPPGTTAKRVPPPPPQGPYMWVPSPGGEGQDLMTPGEIRAGGVQKPNEPPTQAQSLAAGFASRLVQAEPTLTATAPSIRGMSLPSFEVQTNSWFARPTFQSPEVQKYMQAARNFINAQLRRESGAAIQPAEFANAKAQYLPIPGDTDDALALKKANRDLVSANMRQEAGRAYQPPASATPDLTGLPKGRGRRFTDGPFAGQTWALDDNGKPYKVQ